MYMLFLLYFSLPLLFSHFFARFGSGFIIDNGIGHFESVKVHFFLILLCCATLEIVLSRWKELKQKGRKFWTFTGIFTIFFLGWSVSTYPYTQIEDLLFGIGEKQHGILMALGLVWLGILTSVVSQKSRKNILYSLLISGSFVAIIALIESIGYNIFTGESYLTQGSWGDIRSTSTLGNPNYVAGFLLMLLPLTLSLGKRGEKYILFFLIFLGILATKSIIGITIALIYIVALIGRKYIGKKVLWILPITLTIILAITYGLTAESEKWLSLSSRFVLMKHSLIGIFDSILTVFFGNGPDALRLYFGESRAPEITSYFPNNMIIDSSHNIFLDIWSFYGIIGLSGVVYFVISRWQSLSSPHKASLILGGAFLSLNVFVIAHLIIIVFLLCEKKNTLEVTTKYNV